jgi:hypothetical protein
MDRRADASPTPSQTPSVEHVATYLRTLPNGRVGYHSSPSPVAKDEDITTAVDGTDDDNDASPRHNANDDDGALLPPQPQLQSEQQQEPLQQQPQPELSTSLLREVRDDVRQLPNFKTKFNLLTKKQFKTVRELLQQQLAVSRQTHELLSAVLGRN